jgi:hypothetical protein
MIDTARAKLDQNPANRKEIEKYIETLQESVDHAKKTKEDIGTLTHAATHGHSIFTHDFSVVEAIEKLAASLKKPYPGSGPNTIPGTPVDRPSIPTPPAPSSPTEAQTAAIDEYNALDTDRARRDWVAAHNPAEIEKRKRTAEAAEYAKLKTREERVAWAKKHRRGGALQPTGSAPTLSPEEIERRGGRSMEQQWADEIEAESRLRAAHEHAQGLGRSDHSVTGGEGVDGTGKTAQSDVQDFRNKRALAEFDRVPVTRDPFGTGFGSKMSSLPAGAPVDMNPLLNAFTSLNKQIMQVAKTMDAQAQKTSEDINMLSSRMQHLRTD